MRLPVDTTEMRFLVATPPEPVRDFTTKALKADADGQPLHALKLVALAPNDSEIISVRVAGRSPAVATGQFVEVHGLVAQPWINGDRSGVSFRAELIEASGDFVEVG